MATDRLQPHGSARWRRRGVSGVALAAVAAGRSLHEPTLSLCANSWLFPPGIPCWQAADRDGHGSGGWTRSSPLAAGSAASHTCRPT